MRHTAVKLGLLMVPLAFAACESGSYRGGGESAVPPLTVNFTWEGTASCFDPSSPPFVVIGAPQGTQSLHFAMRDLDAPNYNHGGGIVAYTGPNVQRGAFSYKGPCPPSGAHDYEWTVTAIDGAGRPLAQGTAVRPFSQ